MSREGTVWSPPSLRVSLARRCWQLALVLCFIGVVFALLAIWGERRARAAAGWHDPAYDLRPAAVASDLALLSLAGVPDDQVLTMAIEAGELETVHALLALSPDLTDLQRTNGWMWLAYRYERAGQTQRAAQAYRLAGGGAILGGDLPDLLRTEILLTVGGQLIALHDSPGALFYLRQAALLGARVPGLTDQHRYLLLQRVIPALQRCGGKRDDWDALSKAVKGNSHRGGSVAFSWPAVSLGRSASLVAARDARRAAAATLLAVGLSEAFEEDEGPDRARQALRQALMAEDEAVEAYLKNEDGPVTRETRLRWLLLKRRVAAGGAGEGLVPEWTSEREAIDAALTAAWADWLALYVDPTNASPGPPTRAARQAILAAVWGLYPDAPVADLVPVAQGVSSPVQLHLDVVEPWMLPILGWREGED